MEKADIDKVITSSSDTQELIKNLLVVQNNMLTEINLLRSELSKFRNIGMKHAIADGINEDRERRTNRTI